MITQLAWFCQWWKWAMHFHTWTDKVRWINLRATINGIATHFASTNTHSHTHSTDNWFHLRCAAHALFARQTTIIVNAQTHKWHFFFRSTTDGSWIDINSLHILIENAFTPLGRNNWECVYGNAIHVGKKKQAMNPPLERWHYRCGEQENVIHRAVAIILCSEGALEPNEWI